MHRSDGRLPPEGRAPRRRLRGFLVGHDLGIDLGTANTLIFVRGRGIVLSQPSCVAVDRDTDQVLAVGDSAREMLGRATEPVEVIRPLRSGLISDYDACQHMLREFIQRVHHRRRMVRPRVLVCVPSEVTHVAHRAVVEAAAEAGARRVAIVPEPLAAAVGAGLPVEEPRGSMVVDVGGGTTEVAVFVLGGPVVSTSIPIAGDAIDAAVMSYVRKEHGASIGERTAERIKIVGASAFPRSRLGGIQFLARDLASGKPRKLQVSSEQLREGIAEPVADIIDAVVGVFDRLPTEIVPDIASRGIMLTGGGALLSGLNRCLERETGLTVNVDPEPLSCVARGAGILLERARTAPADPRLRHRRRRGF